MSRWSPVTKKDLTIPLGPFSRQGTIFMPSMGMSFRMLTMTFFSLGKIDRCFFDGRNDIAVAGAAAEVAGDRFFDLLFGWLVRLAKEPIGGHEHSRSAIAAFDSVIFPESFLERMQSFILRQPLHGNDFIASRLHGEYHARFHRPPVPENSASTAAADDTTHVGAGKPQGVAEKMSQQRPRLDFAGIRFTVD